MPIMVMATIIITAMMTMHNYERDPKEITRQSFAAIRREADFIGMPEDIVPMALRMIHACGMVDLPADLAYSKSAGAAGHAALAAGAPVLCDVEMVARGIEPFNFCDVRAGLLRGDPRRLVQVLRWIDRGSAVRALFVNIFAGVTDLGEFARLLLQALDALPAFRVPIVARLIGNGFEAARETLAASQVPIVVETDLERALDALAGILGTSHRADA